MKLPPALVGWFIGGLYGLWCRTLRYTEFGRDRINSLVDQGEVVVFSGWHGEIFAFPFRREQWRISAIVSRSRDGEYLAKLLQSQGIASLRGSSSRGGVAALVGAAKTMRDEKRHAYVTVDGPRGPRHEVKDGALYLAHKAEAHIVPLRAVYHKAKIFGSWDKFALPFPFSRVELHFGTPYAIDAEELTEEVLKQERDKLKGILEGMLPRETAK